MPLNIFVYLILYILLSGFTFIEDLVNNMITNQIGMPSLFLKGQAGL